MPSRTSSASQQQLDATNENVLVVMGRLLETTKAASDGIKSLTEEVKTSASGVQAAQQTLAEHSRVIASLDKIVRTGNGVDSLITQVQIVRKDIRANADRLDDVDRKALSDDQASAALKTRVESLERQHDSSGTRMSTIWVVLGFLSWLITTSIALYGVFKK